MKKRNFSHVAAKFRHSRRALALPATFLILFVSTLGLISVTYYFAVERVNARSQTLKVSTIKQDLISIDENVMSVAWQPGSARRFQVSDSSGKLNIQPANGSLSITISDNRDINQTVFSETTGQVVYELPYSDSPDTGLYLRGDSRTLTNQSGGLVTQLCIRNGVEYAEMLLRYRPTVSCAVVGEEDGRTVNKLRIYVVNLSGSEAVSLYGKVPLRFSCESTHVDAFSYSLSYPSERLSVTSTIDGENGSVSIPISSTAEGAIINVEVVQCHVKIQRCLM